MIQTDANVTHKLLQKYSSQCNLHCFSCQQWWNTTEINPVVSPYYIWHLQYILLLSNQLHLCVITEDKWPWRVILLSTWGKMKTKIIIISLQEGFLALHWDRLATIITGILTKLSQLYSSRSFNHFCVYGPFGSFFRYPPFYKRIYHLHPSAHF